MSFLRKLEAFVKDHARCGSVECETDPTATGTRVRLSCGRGHRRSAFFPQGYEDRDVLGWTLFAWKADGRVGPKGK